MLHHTKLDEVAADFDFRELQAAAAQIGNPDPADALQDIDCNPSDIRLQVEDMSEHTGVLSDAFDRANQVLNGVPSAWLVNGATDPGFAAAFSQLRARYQALTERLAATKAAGDQTADDLNQLANDVAKQSTEIVETSSAATALVLYDRTPEGDEPTDSTRSAAKHTVHDACTDITAASTNAIDQIPMLDGPARLAHVKTEYDRP